MKYYYIEVNAGLAITSRTIRTNKGIEAIREHVTHDKSFKKGFKCSLVTYKEVNEIEYNSFISCFDESEQEKVIEGTTI